MAETMIEGVLEADELPDKGVVAAVGLVALMGEEMVKVEFRVDIVVR